MTTAGFTGARGPVHDDKAETHDHKQEADPGKTGSLGGKGDRHLMHFSATSQQKTQTKIEVWICQ